ncbi:MAG TPA: hypothetical protein VK206_25050 [Anaerolineales bacterium]|nr:hypothetical protein [Anaerolineales bacterium]HLO34041.1 hypothetical protein [Anaerolineales bacterium]
MDKFYLAKLVANEQKNEIDHDLAIRHMLKETERGILRVSKTKALILRFTPAVILISVLAFILLG